MANLEVPGIHIQGADEEDATETRPGKGILKDPKRASKVSWAGSVDSEASDVVTRERSDSNLSNHRRSSWTRSNYRISLDAGGAASTLGVLVILKVIFIDILITGFGDAITDLLQGVYMIIEEPLNNEDKWETRIAGVAVILICWVPGIVAILHLIASHKDEFLFLDESVDKRIRKSRRKHFFILLGLCFFFYPIVPTLGYMINLCYMTGGQDHTSHKIEMFAKVGHSISGCIEAPMQMVMVLFLILKEYLPIPFMDDPRYVDFEDRHGNSITFLAQIPVLTFIFSVTNILSSAFTINLFNVYVGQFKDKTSFHRYFNLIGGHFPFFLLQICFRITSFTLLLIYFDLWAMGFLTAMWFCNLIIGYVSSTMHVIPKVVKKGLQRAKSVARLQAGEDKMKIKGKAEKRNAEDTPIWLNSFLSLFVPSCYMRTVDPAIFNIDNNLTDQKKEEQRELRKQFFEAEKIFQRKVIRLQVLSSTTILLAATGLMFFLVEFTSFKYSNNILNNYTFRVACAASALLGILSYVSIGFIDIYDLFGLNKERKEGKKRSRACPKLLLTTIFGLIAIAPLVAGFVFAGWTAPKTGYISLKNYNDTHVRINLITANQLTQSANETHESLKEKGLVMCNNNTMNPNEDICKHTEKEKNILVIDFENDKRCQSFIHEKADNDPDCLKYSSIIFLESGDYQSSSPKQNKIKGVQVLTVHTRDAKDIRRAFQEDQAVKMDILYDTLASMMDNIDKDSDLKKRGCQSLANPNPIPSKGPITLEKEKAADGKLYLSKDSNVKVKSKLDITCKVYGRDCTALAAWKNQASNKEAMKRFEVECHSPVKMKYDIVRKQIDVFEDSDGFVARKHRCFQGQTATVIEIKREQGYDDNDCPLSLRTKCTSEGTWGKWILSEVDPSLTGRIQCHGENAPFGQKSFRFCRQNRCLFQEVKNLFWNDDDSACNKPDHNGENDKTGEKDYVDCS